MPVPCRVMLMTRVTAWTAVTIAIATMTGVAQAPRRSSQSNMASERGFATELQRAFRTDDRQTVASLVRYPARVSVLQRPRPIYVKDREALEQMYDMLFTPNLRCAVVDSREPVSGQPQPKHTLLLARGVVSLAGGRVIAERAQGKYQITRLTSFGDTSTRLGKPRPVTFTGGKRTTELGGRVAELGADGYIVATNAGDRLRASISSFPAGTLWLRVSRRGSATFLDGGKGDSVWEARLTETGEYLVEVVRRAPYCEPPVISHVISLSLTASIATPPRAESRASGRARGGA